MIRSALAGLLTAALVFCVTSESSAALISVRAGTDSGAEGGSAAATFNTDGLGDMYPTFPDTHDGNNTNGFLSNFIGTSDTEGTLNESAWLQYQFAAGTESIGSIRFWNYNDFGGCCDDRSVRDMNLLVSNDSAAFGDPAHASWTLATSYTDLDQGPDSAKDEPYGQWLAVPAGTSGAFAMLELTRTYGSGQVAVAEVQFLTEAFVPEPASLLLALVTMAGICALRRR